MLFPENREEIVNFESISELGDYLNDIFKNSKLYNQLIEVKSDVTSVKTSKRGDLFIELSQKSNNTNYGLTVYIPNGLMKYIFNSNLLPSPKQLLNKKWKFRGTINFWKRSSNFVLLGNAIYPLGISEIELRRKNILEKLKKRDLLRTVDHYLLELEPIKKLAIISSPTAAGYGDFVKNLDNAIYKPVMHLYSSSMQGANTVPEIKESLINIMKSKINYDIVVIIRGGGSKSDLMDFDDEELGFLIAKFNERIPVLTGIGHEQDKSIPDYVSWKSYSTPTEVSRDIVNQINEYHNQLKQYEIDLKSNIKNYFSNSSKLINKNILSSILIQFNNQFTNTKKDFMNNFFQIKKEISNIYYINHNKIKTEKLSLISKNINQHFFNNSKIMIDISNYNRDKLNELLKSNKNLLIEMYQKITSNSPFASFLSKGAIVKRNKEIIHSVSNININDKLKIIFHDGDSEVIVNETNLWSKEDINGRNNKTKQKGN